MITEYHRPKTIEEATLLLARPGTFPMGGGIKLNRQSDEQYIVIDLQALGLNDIRKKSQTLEIGATAVLQDLHDSPFISQTLKSAIKLEATQNLRNIGTVAGALVACDGRSPFLVTMLALNPKVCITPGEEWMDLGNLLPLRSIYLRNKLITKIHLSLHVNLSYQYVARTPMDKPIVCVAMGRWPSTRTRLVLGGWGELPSLAFDAKYQNNKPDNTILNFATQNVTQEATDDWASAEYRSAMSVILTNRCWHDLQQETTNG